MLRVYDKQINFGTTGLCQDGFSVEMGMPIA